MIPQTPLSPSSGPPKRCSKNDILGTQNWKQSQADPLLAQKMPSKAMVGIVLDGNLRAFGDKIASEKSNAKYILWSSAGKDWF